MSETQDPENCSSAYQFILSEFPDEESSSGVLSLPSRKGKSNPGLNVEPHSCEHDPKHSQLNLHGRKVDRANLPGHGSSGSDCGTSYARYCIDCGNAFWVRNSCRERQCPKCYEKWCDDEAAIASERMWHGMTIKYGPNWLSDGIRILQTVVTHVDDGERDIEQCRNRSRARMKRAGLSGGLDIFHPFRQDPYTRAYHKDGTFHNHGVSVALGSVSVNKKGSSCPDDFFKVIPDPVCKSCGNYEPEGESHCSFCGAKRTYDGVQTQGELYDLIRYLLTHCCVVDSVHSLTWYGNMSYRTYNSKELEKFLSTRELDISVRDSHPCPRCHSTNTERCFGWDPSCNSYRQFHPDPELPPPWPDPLRGGGS